MKKLFLFLLLLPCLAAAPAVDKLDLGSGRAATVTVPNGWERAEMPAPPPGMSTPGASARYVPKSGANDAVLITVMNVPDDRMADPANLRKMAELASRGFVRGSVEGKVELKEFKVAGQTGYSTVFTDADLVGKPPVPGDYKTMTCCFVYLGDRVLLNASIFSDDPAGEGFATARRLVQSLTLSLAQKPI